MSKIVYYNCAKTSQTIKVAHAKQLIVRFRGPIKSDIPSPVGPLTSENQLLEISGVDNSDLFGYFESIQLHKYMVTYSAGYDYFTQFSLAYKQEQTDTLVLEFPDTDLYTGDPLIQLSSKAATLGYYIEVIATCSQ
jgi:hypothetical protein